MDYQGYLNKTSSIWAENKLLKFVVVAIGVMVFWNTLQIQNSFDSQKTILIPPNLRTPLEITGNQASESTLDAYSRYIIPIIGTFTPSTARKQFDLLLTFFYPDAYDEAKIQLYDLADRIELTLVSNSFQIEKIISSPNQHLLEIHGTNTQFSSATIIGSEKRIYAIKYKIIDGTFYLTRPIKQFKTVKGGFTK